MYNHKDKYIAFVPRAIIDISELGEFGFVEIDFELVQKTGKIGNFVENIEKKEKIGLKNKGKNTDIFSDTNEK